MLVFLFKQKTAYEMRISDWSSDACSSDLIVVPLQPEEDAPPPARDLNPVFRIAGTRYVMMTQYMAAVSESELKKRAGSLAEEQDRVVKALDMIFSGF